MGLEVKPPEDLLAAASAMMQQSYSPYSKFAVGAALRTASGNIYSACNVENASFPCGQCAESNAVTAMVAAGEREIAEIVVLSEANPASAPCGFCRQVINEFKVNPSLPIYLCSTAGECRSTSLSEILPLAFGPEDLQ